ncbi:MAG TPA: GNAT family N-acetyltransferase [Anaerolineales bacterium]
MATTLTQIAIPDSALGHLRPFDVGRDLTAVADLVEICFADSLDPDGEQYLQQMRSAAHNPGFIRWASAAAEWTSVPLNGYVWEEEGRLVGNVSLIPYNVKGQHYFLIANVGVHPNYRRRGIARSLTAQAIEHARRRGAPAAWLHVRQENLGAISLYQSLGFVERARRTTWHSASGIPQIAIPQGCAIVPHPAAFWNTEQEWLKQAYPPEVTWHLPLNLMAIRPGLLGAIFRTLNAIYKWQWAVRCGSELSGGLTWQSSRGYADTLWLAVMPGNDQAALALLLHARQHLSPRRALTLDYPAGQSAKAIQAAGFYPHQTLIWMSASLH